MNYIKNFIRNLRRIPELWEESGLAVKEKAAKREQDELIEKMRHKERKEAEHKLAVAEMKFMAKQYDYMTEHIADYLPQ